MWSVENEECRKCRVWKMKSVENEERGKCRVWKIWRVALWNVENKECGKCGGFNDINNNNKHSISFKK